MSNWIGRLGRIILWAVSLLHLLESSDRLVLQAQSPKTYEEELIFEDNFDTFDLAKWKHEISLGGNGNNEFEVYVNSRNNSYTKDGILHLRPTLTEDSLGESRVRSGLLDLWGTSPSSTCTSPQFNGCRRQAAGEYILPPVQSARVRTAESFAFKYGRVEVKAKLPSGDWIWPGIWMMPLESKYGGWPSSGEIDIMESRGNEPEYHDKDGGAQGNNRFSSCIHSGPAWNLDGYKIAVKDTDALPDGRSFAREFHVYGLYWSDTEMYTYLDDPSNVIVRVKDYGKKSFFQMGVDANLWTNESAHDVCEEGSLLAPFDQKMYLILNVAVGGTSVATGALSTGYFPDDDIKPWKTTEPFAATSFYNNRSLWYNTWTKGEKTVSDKAALQIDSVKVWGFKGVSSYVNQRNVEFTPKNVTHHECTDCKKGTQGSCIHPSTKVCYSKEYSTDECFLGTDDCSKQSIKPAELLVFEDNFDSLDLKKWKHDISFSSDKPGQFQVFVNSRNNSFTRDGLLYLQPTLTEDIIGEATLKQGVMDLWGTNNAEKCTSNANEGCLRNTNTGSIINPVVSAQLQTHEYFSFRYGRVEVRARLPKGDWLRPSFRLLPTHNSYGEWPQSGEIIFMESRGNNNSYQDASGRSLGHDTYSSGMHFGPVFKTGFETTLNSKALSNGVLHDEFHTFGLYWDENTMYTYLDSDDNIVSRIKDYNSKTFWDKGVEAGLWQNSTSSSPWMGASTHAPFDQSMYLSIGLQVGGTDGFFPDKLAKKPWKDNSTTAMNDFYLAKDQWYSTWKNDVGSVRSSIEIDSVKVWATSEASTFNSYPKQLESERTRGLDLSQCESLPRNNEFLLFSDNFDSLDFTKWHPEITMNGDEAQQFQMFVNSRATSSVKEGTLFIKPMLTSDVIGEWMLHHGNLDIWGTDPSSFCTSPKASGCYRTAVGDNILPPVQSAKLGTSRTFSFKFGRVEVRAKFPKGDWLLPSIRLIPQTNLHGNGPLNGDFDLHPVCKNGENTTCNDDTVAWMQKQNFADEFHVFGMYWDDQEMYFYVDDPKNIYSRVQPHGKQSILKDTTEANVVDFSNSGGISPPFDEELYITLALVVGGNSAHFPEGIKNKPWADEDSFPQKNFFDAKEQWWPTWSTDGKHVDDHAGLQIDSINVWGIRDKSTWSHHRLAGDLNVFAFEASTSVVSSGDRSSRNNSTTDEMIVSISAKLIAPLEKCHVHNAFQAYVSSILQGNKQGLRIWGMQLTHGIVSATMAIPRKVYDLTPSLKDYLSLKQSDAWFELMTFSPLASANASSQVVPVSLPLPDSTIGAHPAWLIYALSAVALLVFATLTVFCFRRRTRGYTRIQ